MAADQIVALPAEALADYVQLLDVLDPCERGPGTDRRHSRTSRWCTTDCRDRGADRRARQAIFPSPSRFVAYDANTSCIAAERISGESGWQSVRNANMAVPSFVR